MQNVNIKLLDTKAMNASVNSSHVLLDQVFGLSIQVVVSGSTPAGTLQIQASNDTNGTPTNWANVGSGIACTANSMTNLDGQHYRWIRVTFTASTGAAADKLTVNYFSKGV